METPQATMQPIQPVIPGAPVAKEQTTAANKTVNTLMASVGALHFIDIPGAKSIPTLLTEQGWNVQRLAKDQKLTCPASPHTCSPYTPCGAAELGLCLAPPFEEQPDSCMKFAREFSKKVGKATPGDPLVGRSKDDSDCQACERAAGSCECTVRWTNSSVFESLCNEPIDGVSGVVYEMNLERNPGSTHSQTVLAQKMIRGITQDCYATTCSKSFIEKMALRNWYSNVSSLPLGRVTLSSGSPGSRSAALVGRGIAGHIKVPNRLPSVYILALVGALVLAGVIACWIPRCRRKETHVTRSADLVRAAAPDVWEDKRYEPLKQADSFERRDASHSVIDPQHHPHGHAAAPEALLHQQEVQLVQQRAIEEPLPPAPPKPTHLPPAPEQPRARPEPAFLDPQRAPNPTSFRAAASEEQQRRALLQQQILQQQAHGQPIQQLAFNVPGLQHILDSQRQQQWQAHPHQQVHHGAVPVQQHPGAVVGPAPQHGAVLQYGQHPMHMQLMPPPQAQATAAGHHPQMMHHMQQQAPHVMLQGNQMVARHPSFR
eukprot:TRINITY_DN21870_c0_g1_i3.p1 TRINITY_DN21870_c0_g1~~TRINITY_DN21870_c0_g1_i3.p1  ORF type:complete len:544 (-),score=82.02 TRINITY_DN21870_c0_g1_i3:624-2255(-)